MRAIPCLFVCAWLVAQPAFAQNNVVEIPFAPETPSTFEINEVRTRTFSERGEVRTRSGRVQSTLELRARGDAFDAVWTTNAADPAAIVIDNGGADPTLLNGVSIALSLDAAGAPNGMSDWRSVRRGMFQIMLRGERDPFWRQVYTATEQMMAGWSPEIAAPTLFETLSIMSACHDSDLTIGEPLIAEVPLANSYGAPAVVSRVTWLLESVDAQAGTARIVHTRTPDPDSINASVRQLDEGLVRPEGTEGQTVSGVTHRTECVVDLSTGMVRSVTFELRMSLGADSEVGRRVVTVTPRQ